MRRGPASATYPPAGELEYGSASIAQVSPTNINQAHPSAPLARVTFWVTQESHRTNRLILREFTAEVRGLSRGTSFSLFINILKSFLKVDSRPEEDPKWCANYRGFVPQYVPEVRALGRFGDAGLSRSHAAGRSNENRLTRLAAEILTWQTARPLGERLHVLIDCDRCYSNLDRALALVSSRVSPTSPCLAPLSRSVGPGAAWPHQRHATRRTAGSDRRLPSGRNAA